MNGTLFLVATPIGNLEDITLRAIRILKEVDYIAAEDTRHSLKLLNHLEITKPMISYHRHNEEVRSEQLLEKLKEGKSIALISDAGTPGISDPGEEIVKKALQEDIKVVPIPGACAAINALIASGMDTKQFLFLGFLPLNKKNRKEQLNRIKGTDMTTILYEAPHKIKETLKDLITILEQRKIVIAREITKVHEEYLKGTAKELLEKMIEPKGEMVLLIEGKEKEEDKQELTNLTLEEHYQYYAQQNMEKKEIIKAIAKDRKVPKNEIYQYFLKKDHE